MMKSKKRIVSMLTVLALVLSMMPAMAFADTDAGTAEVYVTVADQGEFVMIQKEVIVTDADGDGALTINDALYAAHEAGYEGGAAAGYGSAMSDWGLSITKLWGDTSGAFGYCVNDASAWSLADPVADGDFVSAYIYADQVGWSDSYSYFDKKFANAAEGESVELTLSYVGYDASWNKVAYPAAGAVVTVDGAASEFVTDAEGKVTIVFEEGTHVISAVSESVNLVPPVCIANVTAATEDEEEDTTVDDPVVPEEPEQGEPVTDTESDIDDNDKGDSTPQTGDDFNIVLYGLVAVAALAAAALCLRRKTCK